MMYCGFGLDESTDDIASDVLSTLTLVGEFPQASQFLPETRPKSYVHAVEEAIGLDAIENISMPSQLEGLECINTQDLSLIQLQSDLEANPLKCFTSQAPLSPDGILCTMHSINPSLPTELRLGSSEGPWFRRTPTLTFAIGPLECITTMSPPRRLDMDFARNDNITNAEDIGISGSKNANIQSFFATSPCSIVSEVNMGHSKKIRTNKIVTLQEDKALDDVISKVQKCNGR